MKTKKFAALTISLAALLAILIYWRESEARDQIDFYKVLLWQIGVWSPWIFGFLALKNILGKIGASRYRNMLLFGWCLFLVGLHYGWFFLLSSNFSPYIGQYGCQFGVFRYFFVFWTLIDIGLVWFIVDKLKSVEKEEIQPPLLFELSRGNKKYYCKPEQIYWLASENYYTRLFTTEGVFVMRKTLKYFQDELPKDSFMKIHRSTIINVNFVSELARGKDHSLDVVMKDGNRRKVSRSFVKEITSFFKDRTF